MGARPPTPPTLPNQRESQSCFIVMWSGSSSPPNRICTYMWGHAVSQGLRPPPPQLPPRVCTPLPPPAPGPTHVLQRQPQAVTQDPPQVPDLRPHGAPHVLMLQGAEGSARGGCSAGGPHPPPPLGSAPGRALAPAPQAPSPRGGSARPLVRGHPWALSSPRALTCSTALLLSLLELRGEEKGESGGPCRGEGLQPPPLSPAQPGTSPRGLLRPAPEAGAAPCHTSPPAPPSRTRGAGAAAGQACGWAGS